MGGQVPRVVVVDGDGRRVDVHFTEPVALLCLDPAVDLADGTVGLGQVEAQVVGRVGRRR